MPQQKQNIVHAQILETLEAEMSRCLGSNDEYMSDNFCQTNKESEEMPASPIPDPNDIDALQRQAFWDRYNANLDWRPK